MQFLLLDLNKIKYNAFSRSYEFAQSKFPKGLENIPGFDKVIESCICDHTPLEELEAIRAYASFDIIKRFVVNKEINTINIEILLLSFIAIK